MNSRTDAVQTAIEIANDDSHGYSQCSRDGDPDYDCSSLALGVYGFDPDSGYSGSICSIFEDAGATVVDFDGNLDDLEAGDILVKEGAHVAIYIGDGQVVEASSDENGGVEGAESGDQTGDEIHIRDVYDFGWDKVICPPDGCSGDSGGSTSDGGSTSGGEFDRRDGFTGAGVTYCVHTSDGWLPSVSKADDTDDGYAGSGDKPIDGIKVCRADGAPVVLTAHMTNGATLGSTTFRGSLDGENADGDGYCGDTDGGAYIDRLYCTGCNCRVGVAGQGYFAPLVDGHTSDGDGYAGSDGQPIVDLQMWT